MDPETLKTLKPLNALNLEPSGCKEKLQEMLGIVQQSLEQDISVPSTAKSEYCGGLGFGYMKPEFRAKPMGETV